MQVTNYALYSGLTGRRIRTATKVTLVDGTEIAFTERLSKREAVRQAGIELARKAK
jgi:hypothetical protein